MNNIENLKISGAEHIIKAIKYFNDFRKKAHGSSLDPSWKIPLDEFKTQYLLIENISKPLKLHIVFAHMEDYINIYCKPKGLGIFSKQTRESIHHQFLPIYMKYAMKNIYANSYGEKLLKAVVELNSINL